MGSEAFIEGSRVVEGLSINSLHGARPFLFSVPGMSHSYDIRIHVVGYRSLFCVLESSGSHSVFPTCFLCFSE